MSEPRRDGWPFRLAAMAIGLLSALVLAEIAVRVVDRVRRRGGAHRDFEGEVFEFCASRHHRLIANGQCRHVSREFDYVWRNNALGMRDRERTLAKPPGAFRILVLGDSVIQGHGVALEDTMTIRLESRLNASRPRPTIEVLNGGVFGYSPMLESLYLKEIIGTIAPDLVVVGLFLGNDVGEDHYYAAQARAGPDGRGVSFGDHSWPWSLIESALDGERSAVVSDPAAPLRRHDWWSEARSVARRSQLLVTLKTALDGLQYPARREHEFALVRAHRDDIRYDLGLVNYDVLGRAARSAYWSTSLGHLADIVATCRSAGARVAVLVIPPFERLVKATELEEPYQVLEEFGKEREVPVIELLPDFLSADPERIYFRYDRHWTPEGHRLAAAVLERALGRLGLLPAMEAR